MEIITDKITHNNFKEIGKTLIGNNWEKINNSISDMLKKILECQK